MNAKQSIRAILTSDWHLRESAPICRTDDFQKAQWNKVAYVIDLAAQHRCHIIHAGDLFHHWKPSPALLRLAMTHLKRLPEDCTFYTVYGQHDLPQHSMALAEKSGIAVLEAAGVVTVISGSWGENPDKWRVPGSPKRMIRTLHKLVRPDGALPWPGCTAPSASKVLKEFDDVPLIVTGDNHQTFTQTDGERWLINPGSLTRQSSDQADHKPTVFLWRADDSIESHHIPCEEFVISDEHIRTAQERNARLEAFVRRLSDDWDVEMSFEKNLERFLEKNKTPEPVKRFIWKAIGR